jgi:hypothetical protein
MDPGLKDASILANAGSADASMALDLQVVAERPHNLLNLLRELARRGENEALAVGDAEVQVVQDSRAEGGSLASSRLSLLDDIQTLGEGHNSLLLDG